MKTDIIKQKYSKLLIIIAVIIILPSLLYAAKNFTPTPPSMNTTIQPTPTLTQKNIVVSQTAKPFREQMIEKIEKRTSLSPADEKVRTALLEKVSDDGSIYKTDTFRVQYNKPLDLFKVEIIGGDIELAKAAGTDWFLKQGMSQKGICDLPLQFYLNFDVQLQKPHLKNTFNPLPTGC